MSVLNDVLAKAKKVLSDLEADVEKEGVVATLKEVVADLEAEVTKAGTATDGEAEKLADGSQADVQKSSDINP